MVLSKQAISHSAENVSMSWLRVKQCLEPEGDEGTQVIRLSSVGKHLRTVVLASQTLPNNTRCIHDKKVPMECRVQSEVVMLEGWGVPPTFVFASKFATGAADDDGAKIEVKKVNQNRRGGA